MKRFKFFLIIGLIVGLLSSVSSCYIVVRKDRGLHKGWYKSPRYKDVASGHSKFYKKKHSPGKWKKGPLPKNGGK